MAKFKQIKTPTQIKHQVAKKLNVRQDDVHHIVDEYLKLTKQTIIDNQTTSDTYLYIPHLGKFTTQTKNERTANDFQNNTKVLIPKRIYPKFIISKNILSNFKKNWTKPTKLNQPINPDNPNPEITTPKQAREYKHAKNK